jgi:3D (Asp-Asp-Asp) domain-containing protein
MSDTKKRFVNTIFFITALTFILFPAFRTNSMGDVTTTVEKPVLLQNNTVAESFGLSSESLKPTTQYYMVITAYSSTEDQTDSTPFITASQKQVADGIVANNMLPFGTQVKIPELYGDKVFTVEDRMHYRKGNYHLDIWFPTREEATEFGVKTAYIEVIE